MKDEPGRGAADCPASSDEGQTDVSTASVELNSTPTRKVATSSDSDLPPKDNSTGSLPRSHRAVDALRQSPLVEMHRSSSGRNLRLKHLSVADGALLSAPNALTPRAPSGRRPDSRQRLYSADSNNNHGSSNNENLLQLQRSSSFSISAHVLKDLERVRSSTDPEGLAELCERPEQNVRRTEEDDQQQREDSSDESEEIHWDTQDTTDSGLDNIQIEEKAVSNFGLWGKAAKNKRLPDAIIFSGSTAEESKPSYSRSSSASLSSEVQPMDITNYNQSSHVPTPSEMVSQLHITHPHLAALSVLDMPKSMSLTRSTSPRIGRPGFSSLPETSLRRAAAPTNNQQVEDEIDCEANSVEVINPITQWRRGELIGEGTFGKVYKGLNIATGGLFALKEIEIHSSPNVDQVTQMQKLGEEISLMNNLSHKHIVRYKGSHRSANHFYIFMEYVPGGSIASMLKQFDAFSEDLTRIFTRQIVQGVVYLHQMGIVHRDIKGANVLVNEQGVSKLADFGCSKQIPQMLTTSLEESLRSIRGSIPWMAPEVVKQTGHDYKADIWSIGATVIEMATAKHPWPHCHNGLAAMYTIAMATAPPPFPTNLSDEANAFLRRCFCIDPEERATALELSEHAFLAESSPMKVNKFFQFTFLLLSFPSICYAWSVRIHSGGKPTDPSKKFSFSTAQRCYSLSCWNNKSRAAEWSDLPSDARIVFYAGTECQGRYAVGEKKSSGEIDFVPEHLSGDVSSFMVWQSGIYATAGLADLCEENALVLPSDQLNLLRTRQKSLNSSSDGEIKY